MAPLDRIGAALVAAAAAWTLACAAANDGSRPVPVLAALAGVTVAFAAGRRAGRWLARDAGRRGELATGVLAGAVAGLVVRFEPLAPGGGPLGYANANAALFAVVAFAAAAVAVAARRRSAWAVAAAAVALVAASGSVAGVVCLLVGVALAGAGAALGSPRRVAAVAAGLVAVAIAVTAIVGATADREASTSSFGTRAQLWREAVDLAAGDPLTGVGPGRFEAEQGFSDDADLRRAHAEPLQAAAELGLAGAVLTVALPAWALASLAAGRAHAAVVGVGAVAAVSLHSTIDWVVADPAVSFPLAMLAGAVSRR